MAFCATVRVVRIAVETDWAFAFAAVAYRVLIAVFDLNFDLGFGYPCGQYGMY